MNTDLLTAAVIERNYKPGKAPIGVVAFFLLIFAFLLVLASGAFAQSTLTVPHGGSGATTLTGLLKGNGTGAFTAITLPADATKYLDGTGAFTVPAGGSTGISGATANGAMYATAATTGTSTGAMTDGQLLIGYSSHVPVLGTLTGTSNQITVTNGNGTITLATPQSIATASTPQFLRLGLNQAADATASLALTQTALHATSTDGLILQNTTPALVGQVQEYSPRLVLSGTAWKSNATAISEIDKWSIENEPQTGAAATTSNLVFQSSLAGGAYATKMTLTSAGALSTSGSINAGNLGSGVVTTSSGTFTTNALTANAVLFAASSTAVTGNGTKFTYDGTSVNNTSSDAGTTNVPDMFIAGHRSSGTPAAGFGSGIMWTMKDATTNDINAAEIKAVWTDAAHATSTSAIVFSGDQSTTFSEWGRLANGIFTAGVPGTLTGGVKLGNATGSNAVTIAVPASPSAYTFTLPGTGGTNNYFLTTNGSGTTSWTQTLGVANGGTGATTLTGILQGNGTSAVTAIAIPSDATKYLDGTGAFSVPPAGGSSYLSIPILFQISGTYSHTETGTGSNSYGVGGLVETTGATGNSNAYIRADAATNDDIGGKTMRLHARCIISVNGSDYKAFVGVGRTNENNTPFSPVNRWIGIKIERASSGSITVTGTSSDNSTESTVSLSGVTATNWFDLGIDMTSSAVNFYIDGTNKGTITTHIPANLYAYYNSGITNIGVASSSELSIFAASLEIKSY